MSGILFDVDNWHRAGRSKNFQFYVTDKEFQGILEKCLPAQYTPYSLVGFLTVPQGQVYVQDPFEFEMKHFLECRRQGIWNYFIRSHVLTPNLPVTRGMDVDAIYSYNGLINLQQGLFYKDQWFDSRIGVVDKLQNIQTNALIEHEAYVRVFNQLKNAIRSILCYTTITPLTDGTLEESKSILMSEGIVQKYQAGEILTFARPGRRLERKREGKVVRPKHSGVPLGTPIYRRWKER